MKYNHFLQFNNLSTLTSLSLIWTQEVNIAVAMFLEQFLEDDEAWLFPNLADLDVVLKRPGYISSLAWFAREHCPLGPRIRLSVKSHKIPERDLSRLRLQFTGLWSYTGPLRLLFRIRPPPNLTHLIVNEVMEFPNVLEELRELPQTIQSLDIMIKEWDIEASLSIYDLFPAIRDLTIRYGDDSCFVFQVSENLEITIKEWDVEVLFIIRYRFPTIRSLIIRYGSGTLPDDRFIVELGSEILFNLPHLHTCKLLHDTSCFRTASTRDDGAQPFTSSNNYHDSELRRSPAFDQDDLKDYLNAWNRNCPQLRHFQLTKDIWWVRRLDGGRWVKMSI